MNKKLFKILSRIENSIGVLAWFFGFFIMSGVSDNWKALLISKLIGIALILFGYWELKDEDWV